MYRQLLNVAIAMTSMQFNRIDCWKDELRQEWVDSRKLPRKKKKQRRKEILIDWRIANQ